MTLRFGTDGVRGVANRDLGAELLVALGRAAASVLGDDRPFLIGRDTRRSGPFVESALVGGLTSGGADVELVGVLPTPGIAHLASSADLPAIVISASHNPAPDNGVKLFAHGGRKLAESDERSIETQLDEAHRDRGLLEVTGAARPTGGELGGVSEHRVGAGRYVLHLTGVLDGRLVDGLHVIVDAANGAAFDVGPSAFRELGARVEVINDEPDGININEGCGSTHPEPLARAVLDRGADLGLALDGDADRVLAIDATGGIVDGDQLLAILALDRHARGALAGGAVVATVMSNLGLHHALAAAGIRVVETPVGDRHVLRALAEHDLVLGGEQSGHILVRDLATTGDGLLTGILVMDVMCRTGRSLAELAAVVRRVPQVLRNVEVREPQRLLADDAFAAAVRGVESELGSSGRVLVRASGTEPLLRVMVEAHDEDRARELAERLVATADAVDLT